MLHAKPHVPHALGKGFQSFSPFFDKFSNLVNSSQTNDDAGSAHLESGEFQQGMTPGLFCQLPSMLLIRQQICLNEIQRSQKFILLSNS